MNPPKIELYPLPLQQTSVPAFLLKLRTLLDDSGNEHLIAWDENGDSFHLYDQVLFAKEVLPKYFKHNNLASFVRQLNMYGFKKISTVDHGSLQSKEDMEFHNPYFVRDSPELMDSIKRKNPKAERQGSIRDKLSEYGALKPSQVSDVLVDVKGLRNSQKDINQQLDVIKRENSVLWREIASLRQKHVQQQHIINKLIHFLMTMAGSRRNMKRKLPMIESGPSKQMCTDPVLYSAGDGTQLPNISGKGAGNRVTIQDITDNDIPDEVNLIPPFDDALLTGSLSTASNNDAPSPASTGATGSTNAHTPSSTHNAASPRETNTTGLSTPSDTGMVMVPSSPDPNEFKLNFTDNIEGVQGDIDILRDLFSNDTLGFPQDTVYSLFDGSNEHLASDSAKSDEEQLFNLDDLIENATSDRKQQFINNVSDHSPAPDPVSDQLSELNSLITNTPGSDDLNGSSLEALLNQNQQSVPHQPIISTHELD